MNRRSVIYETRDYVMLLLHDGRLIYNRTDYRWNIKHIRAHYFAEGLKSQIAFKYY